MLASTSGPRAGARRTVRSNVRRLTGWLLIVALALIVTPAVRASGAGPAPAPPASGAAASGAAGSGASGNWVAGVQEDLARQEYEVSWQTEAPVKHLAPAWQAPNRAQGFRTYFGDEGIQMIPRMEESP